MRKKSLSVVTVNGPYLRTSGLSIRRRLITLAGTMLYFSGMHESERQEILGALKRGHDALRDAVAGIGEDLAICKELD